MRTLLRCAAIGALAAVLSCGGGGGGNGDGNGNGNGSGTGDVGPAGGTVSLAGGPEVVIPAGALGANTSITIQKAAPAATPPLGALGDVWTLGPDGTAFSTPVTVKLPVPQGTTAATVYSTRPGGAAGYEALPTTVSGTTAIATTTHFTDVHVALPAIRELAACTAKGAARLYAMVSTIEGILTHVDSPSAPLPAGVVDTEPDPSHAHPAVGVAFGFAFDVFDEGDPPTHHDRASTTMFGSTDLSRGYPIGSSAVFHFTLTRDGGGVGAGHLSFTRMPGSGQTLRVTIVGADPGDLAPVLLPYEGCALVLTGLDWYPAFTSDPLLMKATGPFIFTAVVPGGTGVLESHLDASWCVLPESRWGGLASAKGTYSGAEYEFWVDLRDGAYAEARAGVCP